MYSKCSENYGYRIFIQRIYEKLHMGVLDVWQLLYMSFGMYLKPRIK